MTSHSGRVSGQIIMPLAAGERAMIVGDAEQLAPTFLQATIYLMARAAERRGELGNDRADPTDATDLREGAGL